MTGLKARLLALESARRAAGAQDIACLSDVELDAQIEAGLQELESSTVAADEQLAAVLLELRDRGAFPIGAFDGHRVDALVARLQMQEESK